MANPTSVVVLTDTLAQFLARTNQFGEANQELVQQKFNKKEATGATLPIFAASTSRSRALAQWGNMMDDYLLAAFSPGGPQAVAFDNRGSPVVTPSAASGGGTADFTVDVGRDFGQGRWLKLVSNAASVSGELNIYSDVARTKRIYRAVFTGTEHIEGTPWEAIADDASNLESTTLYGTVTNNGASASTYNFELVFQG